MIRPRAHRLPLLSLLLATWLASDLVPQARADERVPSIAVAELPVVGTCAPIKTRDVTHVRVGKREDHQWFAVAGVDDVMKYERLVEILRSRAGAKLPSPHGVWITATGRHAWTHVLLVVKACLESNIYRVGVRVRSEATGTAMGFPLFIPPGRKGAPGPKAGRLDVRVNALHPKEVKGASDVGHVYAAARRAVEQRNTFGVEKIVGKIWISPNAPLQYALTSIDLLYRGGCAGVRVQMSLRESWRGLNVVPVVEIQGGFASRNPQALKPAALAPRAAPWGLNGANEAGWVDFEVSDLPAIDRTGKPVTAKKTTARPNYATVSTGVPTRVMRKVDLDMRTWAADVGADLLKVLQGKGAVDKQCEKRFAAAVRRPETMPGLVTPARRAFPDATRVAPSALQFSAFLFHRGKIQGRADLTLSLTGKSVRVIFGAWKPLDPTASITLVPFGVDPFAAGTNAAFRIWFEGLFHAIRAQGQAAIPLASSQQVLPYLPKVAHGGTDRAIRARGPTLQRLVQSLQGTSYDRVVLAPQSGTATVMGAGGVVGVMSFRLRAEEFELRVSELTPRRAP
jgi:hypothetical protein